MKGGNGTLLTVPCNIMNKLSFIKRAAIMLLCAILLAGLLPPKISHPVHAATASQNNIVARADYMYNILWTCQQDVYGWNYNTLFQAGSRYRVPYGQPINSGAYIGYYVSIDDFITAANTPGSVFYTSRSTYSSTSSVYYATDCSAFVSWCWGIDRKTTYSIPQVSTYIGMATASNTSLLQIGDCLNSNDVGHVVLVTDLVYNSSGTLTSIEITEQTPPQLKRTWWSPSDLGANYGGYYGIYRYTGSVPAAPDGSTNSGGSSSGSTSGKYYPACSSSATTFYGGMSEIGINCDWELHKRIAAKNGITDFSGTADQNNQLLALLKAGQLLNPDYTGSDSGGSSSGGSVTSGSNGYERGYKGGMAGTGEYVAFGLDVSDWQGSSLNFNRIKNAGYDFVILRAGTTNGKDTCFETYYTNAKAAGLDVGVYYYSYATSVSAVKQDMNDFLSYIKGKNYEYPVYFDYEDSSQQALSASTSQQICLTAMDMLAAEGYLVGMYTGKYFSTQLPMSTICAKYEVWIAHYLAVGDGSYDGTGDYWKYGPTYASQYGMYQFTDSVWISGYGPYDGDVVYKDYPSIVKKYGFNGYTAEVSGDSSLDGCTYYPSHAKLKVTENTVIDSEPRSASTDLESISAGTEIVATGLYANSAGNMWYQVKTSDGKTGYLYSQRTEYLGVDTSDIKISGHSLPVDHAVGDVFIVDGTVTSTNNRLDKVSVYIYEGQSPSGDPVTGGEDVAVNNKYTLANSDIDNVTSFGDLTKGVYTYAISAHYTSYYASAKTVASAVTGTALLVDHAFSVGGAELVESYFDQCTFYPSRVLFTTDRDTSIFSEPRTAKTGNTSVALEAAPNGTQYSSTGLYVNAGGNIFYQVTTSDGQSGYIYSGYTTFDKKAYDDIKISGAAYPNGHVKGNTFDVTGTVKSTYNTLGTLKVQVFSGVDTSGTPVTSGSATVSNNKYSLSGSAIDMAVSFNKLTTGLHTYLITVTFSSYYAKSPTELGLAEGTRTVKTHYFTVVSSAKDQTTCSHKNSEAVLKAATCTDTGSKVVYCTTCGLTEKTTIAAGVHSYGSYTTTQAATCTATGTKQRTCTACGHVETQTIAATGHSYSTATCTQSATCTVCGATSGSPAGHSYSSKVTKPTCTTGGYTTYTCSTCGHSYTDNQTSATGHSWKNATCTEPMTCTTCGTMSGNPAGHSYTSQVTKPTCTTGGYTTYTCNTCGHSYTGSQTSATGHNWSNATCTQAATCTTCGVTNGSALGHSYSTKVTKPTCTTGGFTTYTCATCGHSYTGDQIPATGHSWNAATCTQSATCTTCGTTSGDALGHSYNTVVTAPGCMTDGYTTYTCNTCGHSYKGDYITASGHSWKEATCTSPMTCGTCGATVGSALGHSYTSSVTAPGCMTDGYTTYTCTTCGHSYKGDYVTAAGHSWQEATCTSPMTCKNCGTTSGAPLTHSYRSMVTAPGCTTDGYTTYTCDLCGHSYKDNYVTATGHSWKDATCTTPKTCGTCGTTSGSALGHKYVSGKCSLCGAADPNGVADPGLTLRYPTLSFEDEIIYNVYFTVADASSIVEMGLMILPKMDQNATIDDAVSTVPGFVSNGSMYLAKSEGIPAANMGDTLYFKVYAKLTDGTYTYSGAGGYNAKAYANSILTSASSSSQMKSLAVAMLEYGAEAQKFFGHNTDKLVNSALTAEQKALIRSYETNMMDPIVKADSSKTGAFIRNNANFKQLYPSVSFDGAFAINFYCTPAITVDSDMTLYWWDAENYASIDLFTLNNATGKMTMTATDGRYWGEVAGIAAKDMDKTYYVSCVFKHDGQYVTTGIIPYSLGKYCSDKAATNGDAQQPFAQATAVYGYYAKEYFASIA